MTGTFWKHGFWAGPGIPVTSKRGRRGRGMNKQYLYWLYNPTTKLTKIGITENFERRYSQIECACGCDIVIIGAILSEFADKMESLCLAVLSKYRTKGEWFLIDRKTPEIQWLTYIFNQKKDAVVEDSIFYYAASLEHYYDCDNISQVFESSTIRKK
jgi:hypothetical protein